MSIDLTRLPADTYLEVAHETEHAIVIQECKKLGTTICMEVPEDGYPIGLLLGVSAISRSYSKFHHFKFADLTDEPEYSL